MSESSNIAWTDGTFNIAWGCTEISPGCDNCYARELASRFGYGWGDAAPRRYFGDKHWNDPIRWNRKAEKAGKRMKVFCSSMADIFDNRIEQAVRDRLWKVIENTPWIDWQLCTKRIGNAPKMMQRWLLAGCPQNVWMGITVVNQEEAERDIPKLIAHTGFSVRWLSVEPQLGPIHESPLRGFLTEGNFLGIDWIVVGGESGSKARPMKAEWAQAIREQCRDAGVPYFFKQGSQANWPRFRDFDSFPKDLQVREYPQERS